MTTPSTSTIDQDSGSDEYRGGLPARLSKETLQSLSEVSALRFLTRLLMEWTLYLGAAYLCDRFWHPALYALTILWIGGRMNGLSVLMHETTHQRAFKRRALNTLVGEVLLAWPLGITLHGYRNNHFSHHRNLNTTKDPDWVRNRPPQFQFPTTRGKILLEFVKYMTLVNFPYEVRQAGRSKEMNDIPARINLYRAIFLLSVVGLSIYFHFWKQLILYWAIPLLTVFLFLVFFRSVAEHYGGMEYDHPLTLTRTVLPAWWEKWIFGPHNIHYHLEHHLYPSVPCHNLPKLHATLMEDPVYRARAHITKGYMRGVMSEITWDRPRPLAVELPDAPPDRPPERAATVHPGAT